MLIFSFIRLSPARSLLQRLTDKTCEELLIRHLELDLSFFYKLLFFLSNTILQHLIHYSLHFVIIVLIAYWYWPTRWKKAYLILLATMLVDIDHLWAKPIFDADRCSIGFHTFHTYPMIALYVLGAIFIPHKTIRLICIGLAFHMFTDGVDCLWNSFL